MTQGPLKKRLLVIDDDADIRELLQVLLETAGFEVDTLPDGIDAVELKVQDHQVIILDMRMPIFNGAQLVDYWKMTTPEILRRVILLTGHSRMSGGDYGTFATVAKPFDYREMLRIVEDCFQQALK